MELQRARDSVVQRGSAVQRFCSPEILEGDNMFICEQCNQNNTEDEDGETNNEDEMEDSDNKGLWQFRHFL